MNQQSERQGEGLLLRLRAVLLGNSQMTPFPVSMRKSYSDLYHPHVALDQSHSRELGEGLVRPPGE